MQFSRMNLLSKFLIISWNLDYFVDNEMKNRSNDNVLFCYYSLSTFLYQELT